MWTILACIAAVAMSVVAALLVMEVVRLRKRYSIIIDADEEAKKVRANLARDTKQFKENLRRESEHHQAAVTQSKRTVETLNHQYTAALEVYERLQREVSLLEENLEDMSFGLYQPHYDFDDPEKYKAALDRLYKQKAALIKAGDAVSCPNNWTVNGSAKEGKKMIKQESKLLLRAFNSEVDSAVAKVTWNNATKMEHRIKAAYEAVNELGSTTNVKITRRYLDLAYAELQLTFEYETKKQEAKEEQRQIREQMREEELAQREFERAKRSAEADEARYQKALAAARAEVEKAKATELDAINSKIAGLENKLAEAQAKLQHAVSMAQLTKSGHVYVISNIGSFGDDVFKIGMTRRLDPTERVDELGSASVPFPYDIHAMIYTEDAPGLEHAFHREFTARRVNTVNHRKEFFRVSLDELESFATKHRADIQFTKIAEAREYRETIAALEKSLGEASQRLETNIEFPKSLMHSNRRANEVAS